MVSINTNCKLVDHSSAKILFSCSVNCPRRVEPDRNLKLQGKLCAYQKNGSLVDMSDKVTYSANGTPVKTFCGIKHYWSYKKMTWVEGEVIE